MTREEKIKRNAIEYGLAIRDVMIMHGAKREPSETISKVIQMAYLAGAAEADANPKKAIVWLEKQDKDVLIEEIKRRKELYSQEKEKAMSCAEKLSLGGRIAILEELCAFIDVKQGEQKSADKVEPKFKIEKGKKIGQ